jgi:hypothetical protein
MPGQAVPAAARRDGADAAARADAAEAAAAPPPPPQARPFKPAPLQGRLARSPPLNPAAVRAARAEEVLQLKLEARARVASP